MFEADRRLPAAAHPQEMDAYYLNAWVSLFQAGLSLAVAPLAFRMQSPDSAISDMPGNFRDGFMCFFAGMHLSVVHWRCCCTAFASMRCLLAPLLIYPDL